MPLESLDQVNVGNWLVCVCGPTLPKPSMYASLWGSSPGEPERQRGFEGTLFHVLAISPPIILGNWYYGTPKQNKPTFSTIHWDYVAWSKASPQYVEAFLKETHQKEAAQDLPLIDFTPDPKLEKKIHEWMKDTLRDEDNG